MWELFDKLELSKGFNIVTFLLFPLIIPGSIIFFTWRFFYAMFVGECRAKRWTADYDEQYYSIFVRKGFKGCVFSQMSKSLFLRKYHEMNEVSGPYTLQQHYIHQSA